MGYMEMVYMEIKGWIRKEKDGWVNWSLYVNNARKLWEGIQSFLSSLPGHPCRQASQVPLGSQRTPS